MADRQPNPLTLLERICNVSSHDETRWPYLIAEAGVNHEGSLSTAYRLIDEAKEGGADAIKFQTYRAETLASKNSPAYWDVNHEPTLSQYQLFSKYDKFWSKEFEKLKIRCDEIELEFLSTPFDKESADFLNELMCVYKISSSDITNKPFIETICGYGKPILLSTGASFVEEIDRAVSWIDNKNVPLALMHCVLNYPTEENNANLNMIRGLKERYPNKTIGYSDHTMPGDLRNLETATLLGAEIIEKHFTHDKKLPGNDHYHAMDTSDLRVFIKRLADLFDRLGQFEKTSLESEESARLNARRSLVAFRKINQGEIVKVNDLTFKRPGTGISPSDIDDVIGRIATKTIEEDEILTWEFVK